MLPDPRREKQLQRLLEKLGLTDTTSANLALLDLALTHTSIDREKNYEQLEFLGDAVVRLVAAEVLLETYPDAPVGEYAAVRSVLVSDRVLAELAESYGLEKYLILAPSAAGDKAGKSSRLADAFEAILGALYLSTHNMSLIRPWLDGLFRDRAEQVRQDPAFQNYKDALQEWTQAVYKQLPEYRVREVKSVRGSPHRFAAQVWLEGKCLGEGTGPSKKAAEQAAAKAALGISA
ncbi:MAG: ribonuclease III [Jaaginema sp. PMC 1079.18]|nr:ribonuclease III [Jaaginema sp. PMC 1080.18]MEC4849982.1 ribonuclease III [Jaaginema sp. PMC 1079.18]MEC4865188.1 ribonuclease III [Jaaginema sp. PMC 1078.18]